MTSPPSNSDPEALFRRNTRRSPDGCTIRCRLGLWAVSAAFPEDAEREARHYFHQYLQDGEYQKA